ncbi:MAG: cell envelope integrity protein CreD [Rickettsiales bacterium]|nr:MAG: cell envelope integrity protein CreD [Rickettsiales bacterium]
MDKNNSRSLIDRVLENKFVVMCILILVLLIPLGMVKDVIWSRKFNYDSAVKNIKEGWGEEQDIIAPILHIPYSETKAESVYDKEKKIYETKYITISNFIDILPENLKITAEMIPEIREKGIFKVLVHTTQMKIEGNFVDKDFNEFLYDKISKNAIIDWKNATLNIGINSANIRGDIDITFANKNNYSLVSGTSIGVNGISAKTPITKQDINNDFSISFRFNGSSAINIRPIGKKNLFYVKSTHPEPKFEGAFRPENPVINKDGFEARWEIPYIARSYPQVIDDSSVIKTIQEKYASVALFDKLPLYQTVRRLSDYGVMFVVLTFIMIFILERRLKYPVHYIQYVIVGLAITLFFLCVLALSEHLIFGLSYTIASTITILMISLYISSALKNKKIGLVNGLILAVLYTILYLMVSDADYALLIGTAILLATIGAIMWETREINTEK